jgi:hypothetical protein
MITTKIKIEPYLAEYIRGKYFDSEKGTVRIPNSSDLYIWIYDLLIKRPKDSPVDHGNLEFMLPDRRLANYSGGKSPEQFNYISAHGCKVLEKKISMMMWAELHDKMDEDKHRLGIQFKDSCYEFITKYSISSISEDGLFKNYQRWRDTCKRRQTKRSYARK